MSDLSPLIKLTDIRNVVRLEHNSLFQSIGYVLSNHWDPLDISVSKRIDDRYDRFIPNVYTHALKSEKTADLAQYLGFLSADVLGVPNNKHNDKNSARIIMAVKKFYVSNVI
jgi:hypothetical protein